MTTEDKKPSRRKKSEPSTTEVNPVDFEQSLSELEALVEEMETGKLSLEASLSKFEKGIALTQNCQNALKSAEQRVNILLEKNGEPSLAPFNESDE